MTDYPIIFSGPMVQALLAGRKTMTRRLAWRDAEFGLQDYESQQLEDMDAKGWNVVGEGNDGLFRVYKPTSWQRVKPGDRLWVRENLCAMANWGLWHDAGPTPKQGEFLDDLDERGRSILERYAPAEATDSARVPSIFMPRWASRLTLIVTATKIEPLLDISEDDARAEGFERGRLDDGFGPRDFGGGWKVSSPGTFCSAAGMFQVTWTKLHPEWDGYSSPDVVALTFRVQTKNIDALPLAA